MSAAPTPAPSSYFDLYLAPLRPWLEQPQVTDLYVNRPGELWVETLGGEVTRHDVPGLDAACLGRLARQIAGLSHQGIDRTHPLLAATLPDGPRVQVVAPPATRGHLALALRRHLAAGLTLADYARSPAGASAPAPDPDATLRAHLEAGEHAAFLAEAVRRRLTILVSGGTSSGKTTLLNALLAEVPLYERLVLIEDTPELVIDHPNSVGLVAVRGGQGEAHVTPDDLLLAALRLRPDRIVLGELRGAEAFTFLRAANTGHPGSMTTLHADSPERALEQLALMTLQARLALPYDAVAQLVRRMVDVVVQVERRRGARCIADVQWISGDTSNAP